MPISDIISCCTQEILINRNWFETKEQFDTVIDDYSDLCEKNIANPLTILDMSILCMELIPQPSGYHFKKWYWKNRIGLDYSDEMDEVLSYIEENKSINVVWN